VGPDQAIIPTRRLHPGVSDILLSILADKVRQSDGRLLEALFIPAEIRVLRRLVELVDLFGEADRPLTIPLRQEDRASLAGTSRAAVNRVLRAEENAVRSRCNEAERPFSIDPGASTGRADIAGFVRSTCTARTMGLRSRRIRRRGPAATLYYSRSFAATVGIAPARCPLERPAADRTRTPWPHRRRPVYW
jgi:hypothetical protein